MFDPSPYIGIPFDKLKCWELVREVYRAERGIVLPEYPDVAGRADADQAAKAPIWTPAVRPLRPFDILVFRVAGAPVHVGLLISGRDFLHTLPQTGAVKERLSGGLWPRRFEYAVRLAENAQDAPGAAISA